MAMSAEEIFSFNEAVYFFHDKFLSIMSPR